MPGTDEAEVAALASCVEADVIAAVQAVIDHHTAAIETAGGQRFARWLLIRTGAMFLAQLMRAALDLEGDERARPLLNEILGYLHSSITPVQGQRPS